MLRTQSLRLVWFPSDQSKIDVAETFRGLLGEDADGVTTSKSASAQNPLLGQATKILDDVFVALEIQFGRMDLVIQPRPDAIGEDGGPPTLSTADTLAFASRCIDRSEALPPSYRLSVLASTIMFEASLEASRAKWRELAGIDLNIIGESDHFLQVNRTKDLASNKCNRLIQLAVVGIQRLVLSSGPNALVPSNETSYGVSIVYDFNTVPTGINFDALTQRPIFKALLAEVEQAVHTPGLNFLRTA